MSDNSTDGLGGLFDFSFEKFITPSIVKIVYIVVIVMAGLWWLSLIFLGISAGGIGGFLGGLIFGGLAALLMVLFYRIFLELTMILFRIHDNTDVMANKQ
ncbi:MAG: DUF4282 domain-containing protein [Actinomycetia bacterium]|nr:DUF4282 domain-containing protein [Actinomycetes bacterium]